jgi:hypothetical protein
MRAMMLRFTLLASLFALVPACGGGGGDGDLDPEVVTNLPPGDGTGGGATGVFAMESITTSCDGECTIGGGGGDPGFSVCDVGTRLDETADVTQTDGELVIDIPDSQYVSRLEGGIFADNTFEVGGYVTQQGGEVEITSRVTGTVSGANMTGTGRLRVSGLGASCTIGVDVDGTRAAPTFR